MLAELARRKHFEKGFQEGYAKAKEEMEQTQQREATSNPPAQQPSEESTKQ